MKKNNSITTKAAATCASLLNKVLAVCANTGSSFIIHQPKTPTGLAKFNRMK